MLKTYSGLSLFLALSFFNKVNAVEFRFQVETPGAPCSFQGTPVVASVFKGGFVSADVNVVCSQRARQSGVTRYYLNTDLAPAHLFYTKEGRWELRSSLAPSDQPCEQALNNSHSGFYQDSPAERREGSGDARWRVCVGMTPLDGQIQTLPPVDGQILVTLSQSPYSSYPEGTVYRDALFAHDKAELSPREASEIEAWLNQLGPLSRYRFEIHANTSEVGDPNYNYALSVRRLAAVRGLLTRRMKISDSMIWGQAWGEHRLKALNQGEVFDRLNRRVSIIAIPLNDRVSSGDKIETPGISVVDGIEIVPRFHESNRRRENGGA